jgi:hypothetical protein
MYKNISDIDLRLNFWYLIEDVDPGEDKTKVINDRLDISTEFIFKDKTNYEIIKIINTSIEDTREYSNQRLHLYNLIRDERLIIQRNDGCFLSNKEIETYLQNQLLDVFSKYEQPESYVKICGLANYLKKTYSYKAINEDGVFTIPGLDEKYIPDRINENELQIKPIETIHKFRKNIDLIVGEFALDITTSIDKI